MDETDILHRFTLSASEKLIATDEEIGRGAYGRVFKINYYGTMCAAKEIHSILLENIKRQELEQIKTTFLRECRQCCVLRHPNIVQFLGLHHSPSTRGRSRGRTTPSELPIIVMELMQSSLKSYVESSVQNKTPIPYVSKLSILQDIARGLMYLHHQNPPVVHRDLSPNNVLLTEHLVAKLSDLGVAKAIKADSKKTMTKVPGTSDFMPPEALEDSSKYGPSLDIFSYGGVSLYLICQQWPELLPIKRFDPGLRKAVALTELERRQPYTEKVLGDAKDLKPIVLQCLDDDPHMRPIIEDVLDHVTQLKLSSIEVKSQLDLNKELQSRTVESFLDVNNLHQSNPKCKPSSVDQDQQHLPSSPNQASVYSNFNPSIRRKPQSAHFETVKVTSIMNHKFMAVM